MCYIIISKQRWHPPIHDGDVEEDLVHLIVDLIDASVARQIEWDLLLISEESTVHRNILKFRRELPLFEKMLVYMNKFFRNRTPTQPERIKNG